jgi:hypothetical protein
VLAIALSKIGCLTNLASFYDGLVGILSDLFFLDQWNKTGHWTQPSQTGCLPNIIMLEEAINGSRICFWTIWEILPINILFPRAQMKDTSRN